MHTWQTHAAGKLFQHSFSLGWREYLKEDIVLSACSSPLLERLLRSYENTLKGKILRNLHQLQRMPCVKTLFKITDFCRFFFFNIKSIKIWNAERSFGKYVFNTRKKNIYFNEMMTFKLKRIFCFKINLKNVPWYEGKTH